MDTPVIAAGISGALRSFERTSTSPALRVFAEPVANLVAKFAFSAAAKSRSPLEKSGLRNWCPRGDSNPHAVRHRLLRPACLPVPPPGHLLCCRHPTGEWCDRQSGSYYAGRKVDRKQKDYSASRRRRAAAFRGETGDGVAVKQLEPCRRTAGWALDGVWGSRAGWAPSAGGWGHPRSIGGAGMVRRCDGAGGRKLDSLIGARAPA